MMFVLQGQALLHGSNGTADDARHEEEIPVMSGHETRVLAERHGTALTRFNALRYGVLSRYTVLPWEETSDYEALLATLATEHNPHGPTEEHLVEALAGVVWRERRLRLAEAATHHRGLQGTLDRHSYTGRAALVHVDGADMDDRVVDAVRMTAADAKEERADLAADEAMTRAALPILDDGRNDAYAACLAALRENTRE